MTELAPFGAGALGRSERVHPTVRWLAVPILIVLLIGFALLYISPGDTEGPFAWAIRPPTTALVVGAGYGAAAFFWWRVLTAETWHHIGTGLPATAPFTWAMALATLLHWEAFDHAHFIVRLWVVVHAATPLIVAALWLANRGADSREPDRDDMIVRLPVRGFFAVVAAAMLAVAVVMFARPALIIDRWAWSITPLTAQVLAGWLAVPGIQFMGMAVDRRWSAWRYSFESAMLGFFLMLVGHLRAWGDLDLSRPAAWFYLGGLAAALITLPAVYVVMEIRAAAPRPGRRRADRS